MQREIKTLEARYFDVMESLFRKSQEGDAALARLGFAIGELQGAVKAHTKERKTKSIPVMTFEDFVNKEQ